MNDCRVTFPTSILNTLSLHTRIGSNANAVGIIRNSYLKARIRGQRVRCCKGAKQTEVGRALI